MVREPHDVPLERPGGRQHPLELDAGDHVRIPPPAELALAARVELLEAGGQNDRADLQFDRPLAHEVIDRVLLAGFDTLLTLGAQGAVQAPLRLGEGLLLRQPHLHFVEAAHSLGHGQLARLGARLLFDVVRRRQKLLRDRLDGALEPLRGEVLAIEVAFDGLRRPLSGRDGLDHRLGPETASPPAKTPSSEVWSVTGSALKYRPWVAAPICLMNSSSLVCPMAVMI